MKSIITLQPDFSEYTKGIIIEHINNPSEINIYGSFNFDEFNIFLNNFKNIKSMSKETYYKNKKNVLVSSYSNQCSVFTTNDDAIKFSMSYNIITPLKTDAIKREKYDFVNGEIVINIIEDYTDAEIDETDIKHVGDIEIMYDDKDKEFIVDNIISVLNTLIVKKKTVGNFYTISMDSYGYDLDSHDLPKLAEDPLLKEHYTEKFLPTHVDILNNLKHKTHGLFLLYGISGSGKTSYTRHLISAICDIKKVIYVPAYMIEQIANPEFISFIQKHKKSVLILEDAEFALRKRSSEFGAQAVSNLLNITNGLLNDATQIQVIATFNMDKKEIDSALTRPGRLLNEWKFDKLSYKDAVILAKAIGKNIPTEHVPMTVAEVYEEKIQTIKSTTKKMGFTK